MALKMQLVVIKWDQKLGGMQEFAYPKLEIKSKDAMNIYNLHRTASILPGFASVRINLENGEQFNVCSFFSGFGGTSPDGFTGNYGKNKIGISEKVVAWFLPNDFKASDYWEILMKLAARILIDSEHMGTRMEKMVKFLDKKDITKRDELVEIIDNNLNQELGLTPEQIRNVLENEIKAVHYLITEFKEQIKDLKINPAQNAFQVNKEKIAAAKQDQETVRKLLEQITQLSGQKSVIEAVDSQKDEIIETLKADYVKIFGTLTDQIMQLENEVKGIQESTQSLVTDLNDALSEKIAEIAELEEKLKTANAK